MKAGLEGLVPAVAAQHAHHVLPAEAAAASKGKYSRELTREGKRGKGERENQGLASKTARPSNSFRQKASDSAWRPCDSKALLWANTWGIPAAGRAGAQLPPPAGAARPNRNLPAPPEPPPAHDRHHSRPPLVGGGITRTSVFRRHLRRRRKSCKTIFYRTVVNHCEITLLPANTQQLEKKEYCKYTNNKTDLFQPGSPKTTLTFNLAS